MTSELTVSSARGRRILLATILASGMAFLDGTVVTVALPQIQSQLQAKIAGIQWVVNAYALTLSALLLTCGSLGDHFGRRKMFTLGIVLFVLGSLSCALSATINQLIATRAFQGIGAAFMIPGSLAIINASFAEAHRGQAIGLWAGLSGGIIALGPFVGGYLVETLNWQSIFYLNVPLGVVALLVTLGYVPESRGAGARPIDWWGTVLITLSLLGLSYGLIEGPIRGWDAPLIVAGLAGGAAAFLAFAIVEARAREPMVPLGLLRRPLVGGANLVTFFLYFALGGMVFFMVLNLQQVQDYSPTLAGLGLLPSIVLITLLSGPAGSLADRIGPRPQMIVGPLAAALGAALLALSGREAIYVRDFLPGMVLFGLGMALVIAPLTKSALSVEERLSGLASGVNNAVSRIAGLMAVAVLGALAVSLFSAQLNATMQGSALGPDERGKILAQADRLGGVEIPPDFAETSRRAAENAVEASFIYGFRWAMGLCAALALLSSLIAVATIRPDRALDGVRPRAPTD